MHISLATSSTVRSCFEIHWTTMSLNCFRKQSSTLLSEGSDRVMNECLQKKTRRNLHISKINFIHIFKKSTLIGFSMKASAPF